MTWQGWCCVRYGLLPCCMTCNHLQSYAGVVLNTKSWRLADSSAFSSCMQVFRALTSLAVLDLSDTEIGPADCSEALHPTQPQSLMNANMCCVAAQVFRALTSLAVLDLSDTEIGPGGVHHLRHCRAMLRLSLCNTDAGDGSAASLANLVSHHLLCA
jgi:hypothetical protein